MSETCSNQEIFSPHQVNLRQWRQLIIPVPPQLIALLSYFFWEKTSPDILNSLLRHKDC